MFKCIICFDFLLNATQTSPSHQHSKEAFFCRGPDAEEAVKKQVPLARDDIDDDDDDNLEKCGGCRRGMKDGHVR